MGIFSNSNSGRGFDADASQKRSFFRFFEIFFGGLGKFVKASLLYSVALIPTFIIVTAMSFWVSVALYGEVNAIAVIMSLFFANLYVSLWGAGPATAGATYVMRNYARGDHAWLWNDFKTAVKTNFRQMLIIFLIDIVLAIVFYVSIGVYSQMTGAIGAFRYVIIFIIFIYTMMHLYIYPMMVTFELPLIDLYKNSLLFAITNIFVNVMVIAVLVFVHVILPMWAIMFGGTNYLIILIALILLEPVVMQAFSTFLVNFSVYPSIKKYMLDTVVQDENDCSEDKGED